MDSSGKTQTSQCTGFLVPNQNIITAAHCLSEQVNFKPDSFIIYFGQTDESTFLEKAVGNVDDCNIPPRYTGRAGDAYDYALCPISRTNINDEVQPLMLAMSQPANQLPITMVGYPVQGNAAFPNNVARYTPYQESCDARWVNQSDDLGPGEALWFISCSAEVAQSGSPLLGRGSNGVIGSLVGAYDDQNYGASLGSRPAQALPP